MDKQQAFAALNALESTFLDSLAHPDGGKVVRAMLRNVDAELIRDTLIVFKNKDGKFLVLPLENGERSVFHASDGNDSKKKFPDIAEIKSVYITEILPWLIKRDTSIADDDKMDAIEFIPDWMQRNPFSGANTEKIKKYKELKSELESLGLI